MERRSCSPVFYFQFHIFMDTPAGHCFYYDLILETFLLWSQPEGRTFCFFNKPVPSSYIISKIIFLHSSLNTTLNWEVYLHPESFQLDSLFVILSGHFAEVASHAVCVLQDGSCFSAVLSWLNCHTNYITMWQI